MVRAVKSATKNLRRASGCAWGRRASITRNTQLADSPAVASRPAEAARCLGDACGPPDARLPSARCRIWRERFGAHSRAILVRYQTTASLRLDGRGLPGRAPRCHRVRGLLEVECEGYERPTQLRRRMDVPNRMATPWGTASSARDARSVVAVPSRRLPAQRLRSLAVSPEQRRDRPWHGTGG